MLAHGTERLKEMCYRQRASFKGYMTARASQNNPLIWLSYTRSINLNNQSYLI